MTFTMHSLAPHVSDYIEAVARRLGHLSADDRDEVLSDLREHLVELDAPDAASLRDHLGAPELYADELLVSAGLAPNATAPTSKPISIGRVERWRSRTQKFMADNPEVRPLLLAGRGIGLGCLVAVVFGLDFSLTVVVVALAIAASVVSGRHDATRRGWGRTSALAILGALSLFGLLLGVDRLYSGWFQYDDVPVEEQTTGLGGFVGQPCPTNADGVLIENLYPYNTDGELLDNVLLYDQTGRPIDNLCPSGADSQGRQVETTYAEDINGAAVYQAFPRNQRVAIGYGPDGTPRWNPLPPPAVVVPRVSGDAPASTSTSTTVAPTSTTLAPTSTSVPVSETTVALPGSELLPPVPPVVVSPAPTPGG